MKKTALLIMAITVLCKIFGFAREVTLSYYYGASSISDAYLISITIPYVIFGFVATGLAAGFIPMYSKILQDEGEIRAVRFTSNLMNVLIVICTVLIFIGLLFTDQIVKVFASGFAGQTFVLAVQFTKISFLAIYFTGITGICSGYLQIKGNYLIPALIALPMNLLIIISIIISPHTNILVLAAGFVTAAASQVLLMIPFMYKNKYKHYPIFRVKDRLIINMMHLVMPIIMGMSVHQINVLVDRTMASQIAIGGISALNYADRLNGFVLGIFVLSITTVIYPIISKMAAEKDVNGLKKVLSEAITGINLMVMPITVGSMVFAVPIVSILFGRGAFDHQALSMTSSALFFYSIGMVAYGLRDVLSRAFYSMQDTKIPMINAAIGMTLNIVLNIILSKYLGIGGLALATAIAAMATSILLVISLRKKIGPFGIRDITVSFLKIIFASLIMGLLAKISFNSLNGVIGQNLSLLMAIIIGALSYFVMISFMRIKEVEGILGAIKLTFQK